MTILPYRRPELIIVPALRKRKVRNNRLGLLLLLSLLVHILALVGTHWFHNRQRQEPQVEVRPEFAPIEFVTLEPEIEVETERISTQSSDDGQIVKPDAPVESRQQQAAPTVAQTPSPPATSGSQAAATQAAAPAPTQPQQTRSQASASSPNSSTQSPDRSPATPTNRRPQPTQSARRSPPKAEPRPQPQAAQNPAPKPSPAAPPITQTPPDPIDDLMPAGELFSARPTPQPTLPRLESPTPSPPSPATTTPDLSSTPPAFRSPSQQSPPAADALKQPTSDAAASSFSGAQSQVGLRPGNSQALAGGSQLAAQGLEQYNRTLSSDRPGQGQSVAARQDVDMGPYVENLRRQVERQWFPVQNNRPSKVVVRFDISRAGGLQGLYVASTSGSAQINDAALSAIQRAAPFFGTLPTGYPHSRLQIEFSFTVTVEGNLSLY